MSKELDEVTFSKVKTNGTVAKKKMPVFKHGNWREFLVWTMQLKEHYLFMGYTPSDDDQDDFIEDVQLLLQDEDLQVFNDIARDPEIPRAAAVVAAMSTLTAYHCPPGTRDTIVNELDDLKKRANMTVRGYSSEFRRLLRMMSMLQHGENVPMPMPDILRMYRRGMPVPWQLKFNDIPQIWYNLQQVETTFELMERNELRESAIRGSRKPRDSNDTKSASDSRTQRSTKSAGKNPKGNKNCNYCKEHGYTHTNHNTAECFKDPDSPKYKPLRKDQAGGKKGSNLQTMQRQLETLAARIETIQKNEYAAMRFYTEDDDDIIAVHQSPSKETSSSSLEVEVLLEGSDELVTALLDTGCTSTVVRDSAVTKAMSMVSDPSTYKKADGSTGSTGQSSVAVFTLPKIAPHRKCTMPVRVSKELLYPVILGLDFLRAQGIVLDFANGTMKWDEVVSPMRQSKIQPTPPTQSHANNKESDHAAATATVDPCVTDDVWVGTAIPIVQKSKILGLIARHPKLCTGKIGTAKLEPYVIPLKKDARPHAASPYPIPRIYYNATRQQVQDLLQLGILEPDVSSPWASPAFVVAKKDGSVRLVADFRRLNLMLERHYFPLPKILEILHHLPQPKYITTLDLVMGYYARVLAEQSRACTAIVLPFGKYRYCRLPMGIATAPDEFQAMMTALLGDLEFVRVYLDDVLVLSQSFEEHLSHLETVFERLEAAGLVLNMTKSRFCVQEAEYLGYKISVNGIAPLQSKVEGIQKIAVPKTRRELRRFIGMVNYYRDIVPKRAGTLAPLTAMCSPKVPFKWTETHSEAFNAIKRALIDATSLAYPDFGMPFEIYTDASKAQLGAVVAQGGRPLIFWSKKCNDAQRKYPANKLELLSILLLLREFRTMLMGQQLHIHTDHKNLTCENYNNVQMLRWRLDIEEFGPRIEYVKGENNVVADALSRLPRTDDADTDLEEKARPHHSHEETVAAAVHGREPIDLEEIARKQKDDAECNDVKSTIEREVSGVVLRASSVNNKILVPRTLRKGLMETYHDWLIHPGASVMYKTIGIVFHWPNIDKDIQNYVRKCQTCSTAKYATHKYGKLPEKSVTVWPWFEIAVDTIGPFGDQGFRAMTIIDTSTRLIEMHAMRDGTSAEAAAIVDRYWLNKYPRPRRCVYDQGSEFKLEFLELLDSYGVDRAPTTTRNPQANAVIERVHRVIGDKMRTREIKDHDDWDSFLHNVTFALRASCHTMTGASPAQLAFGRDMMVDLRHETDWAEQREKKLQQVRAHNQRENSDRRDWKYQPGDRVFLKNDVKVRGKLLPVQSGPYQVVTVRENGTLTIDKGKYVETVSIRRISPCRA